jgi:hypothetical protein
MQLYRVENLEDRTDVETVGSEIRRFHRTYEGAQDAIDTSDWDLDWGIEPILVVVPVDKYETQADAEADGWMVVD